ncbi:uncharacterized protein C8A04DRAFT_33277 [Dichotomopilus funicola]|uniref:2EXR domain-containing protein n=1 Tax=Dichotomopilus funicola TaxID=1934379 RepID=A0AAN6ZI36_9PEZI|nr:hypothetical protein C8A04DRAFT_33277 [Dichotomopilus funicola]
MIENSKDTEPSTFTLFSRLPADIRQEIWRIAASEPAYTPGICFFPAPTAGNTTNHKPGNLTVQEPANINILATNTEAHDIALVSPPITRLYDPAIDILFLRPRSFRHFTGHHCSFGGPAWVTEVRHLALGLSITLFLEPAIPRLTSLQTLSVVYPAASGTFAFDTDVDPDSLSNGDPDPNNSNFNPRSNQPLRLRRLTPAELDALTIEADYMYQSGQKSFPIRWTRSGKKHMEMVERGLNRYCRPEHVGEDRLSPLWDHAANRLGIRYVARVFVRGVGRGRFAG